MKGIDKNRFQNEVGKTKKLVKIIKKRGQNGDKIGENSDNNEKQFKYLLHD